MSDEYEFYVKVRGADGVLETYPALEGWRLMEVLRDNGLPIKGECGGALACATCHVHVAPEWLDACPPMRDEEDSMLDEAVDVRDNSRLSCQILINDRTNGIIISIPAQGD